VTAFLNALYLSHCPLNFYALLIHNAPPIFLHLPPQRKPRVPSWLLEDADEDVRQEAPAAPRKKGAKKKAASAGAPHGTGAGGGGARWDGGLVAGLGSAGHPRRAAGRPVGDSAWGPGGAEEETERAGSLGMTAEGEAPAVGHKRVRWEEAADLAERGPKAARSSDPPTAGGGGVSAFTRALWTIGGAGAGAGAVGVWASGAGPSASEEGGEGMEEDGTTAAEEGEAGGSAGDNGVQEVRARPACGVAR
jgi:hypothetical protein